MTTDPRVCASCKTPLLDDAHFCSKCGTPTPTEPGVPERTMPTGAIEVSRVRKALASSYRIEHVLGEGGMATVYLAEDLKHHRKVAVKVMRPELVETLGSERFLREIEIAAKLSHPNILPVYDSGAIDGVLFYVMPVVEGESLPARLRREKQLPINEAIRLAREVAEALAYAHKRGIVHRDIKPANILINEGHALVADFGIARATGGDAKALTQTGLAIGTPLYMSPEQSSGEPNIDGRSDVYALGCVLYEMIAGEPPFTGPTAQVIISRSMTEAARPLTSTRPSLSPLVDSAVQKALAKAPADRYATASEMAEALETANSEQRTANSAAPFAARRSPLALWKIAAIALLVLGVGAAGWKMLGSNGAGASDTHRVAVLPFENQGADDEAYFADGIVEELRNRLARLDGFTVIASTSADLYRETTKSATEIARELRVTQVLTGRVRWANAADGTRQFQVVTELVDGETGEVTWRDTFTGTPSDPFAVQEQIATRVAGAMGAALSRAEVQNLAGRPTDNAEAYALYLQAREILDPAAGGLQPLPARRAADLLERAVALDADFSGAWIQLARAQIIGLSRPVSGFDSAAAARGKEALDRAVALAPDSLETRMMQVNYHSFITDDTAAIRRELAEAVRLFPDHPRTLTADAFQELADGNLEAAVEKLARARDLDPRNVRVLRGMVEINLRLGRYPEAKAAAGEVLSLESSSAAQLHLALFAFLAAGDTDGARRAAAAVRSVPRTEWVTFLAGYDEVAWLLSDEDRRLLFRLPPAAFDNNRAWWGQSLATAAWQQGDRIRARAYADSSLAEANALLAANPENSELRVLTALTLAYLGRKADAIREADLAISTIEQVPAGFRPYIHYKYADLLVVVGEHERAVDHLEQVLTGANTFYTPGLLRADPMLRPLHGNPRFERLANRGIGAPVD